MLSGQLDSWIDGKDFTIDPGDSFRIRDESCHQANPCPESATALRTIARPIHRRRKGTMTEIPKTARLVVVGGHRHIVLYHLALAGQAERVLLKRNALTAGSS